MKGLAETAVYGLSCSSDQAGSYGGKREASCRNYPFEGFVGKGKQTWLRESNPRTQRDLEVGERKQQKKRRRPGYAQNPNFTASGSNRHASGGRSGCRMEQGRR